MSQIPRYDEIMPIVLQYLANHGQVVEWKSLELVIAQHFQLSEEDLSIEYESGNGRIFLDRISWALSYLFNAGLVERPKRGHYQISEQGRSIDSDSVRAYVKVKISERDASKREATVDINVTNVGDAELTPTELIEQAANSVRETVYEDIISTILKKSPYEFEKLVVKLLEHMGYGGLVKGSGMVTKKSNDGGIDGIIKEDVLGLGRIHIQAKRYCRENTVGREDVQKFVGALAVAQSNKGVFITTSSFSKGAIEYADSLNGTTNVVLIDGGQLAEYIYDYDIGMQTEQVIKIKRMDSDFWDDMANV